mmetsp:Transcript_43200/g.123550  ORF Transcript_43200/g.123550 Transcript_43200/m.123550 type:complete len:228 (-) Transcript_43200:242-925(-)
MIRHDTPDQALDNLLVHRVLLGDPPLCSNASPPQEVELPPEHHLAVEAAQRDLEHPEGDLDDVGVQGLRHQHRSEPLKALQRAVLRQRIDVSLDLLLSDHLQSAVPGGLANAVPEPLELLQVLLLVHEGRVLSVGVPERAVRRRLKAAPGTAAEPPRLGDRGLRKLLHLEAQGLPQHLVEAQAASLHDRLRDLGRGRAVVLQLRREAALITLRGLRARVGLAPGGAG